jgi:hypothetical protein
MKSFSGWSAVMLAALVASEAHADAPKVTDLNQATAANEYVVALEQCEEKRASERPACIAAAGTPQTIWDRDRNGRYDRRDVELAITEYWDGGKQEYVCYDGNGGARFAEECDRSRCLASHSEAQCKDDDHDGLFAYQESALGFSDADDNTCLTGAECGFTESCRKLPAGPNTFPRPLCLSRTDCGAEGCTAFSLVQVAQDDRELIVHLRYDYSPMPARVLDLRVDVPAANLTLTDARLLKSLNDSLLDKQISTRVETVNGVGVVKKYIRVTVFGTSSLAPIRPGLVAELVFAKSGPITGTMAFSAEADHRRDALAPDPSEAREELTDNNLWGGSFAVGSTSQKLLAHYRFDGQTLDAPGAMAEEAFCNNTPCQGKAKRQAREARGGFQDLTSLSSEAVLDQAARFSAAGQHIEVPVFPRSDLQKQSWSFWLNPDDRKPSDGDQLVWGHSDALGVLRYGVFAIANAGGHKLIFREYDPTKINPVETPISSAQNPLPARGWSHVAIHLSADTRKVDLYLNAQKAASLTLGGEVAQCPLSSSPSMLSEDPGERLYVGAAHDQRVGVQRMDAFGTTRVDVLRDAKASMLDPDYSGQANKLAFASTRGGSQEIWVADADGANAQQVTFGFGDTKLSAFARRPRFSPSGNLLLFESNVYNPATGDNAEERVYRLFAITFNPVNGSFTPLTYADLVRTGDVNKAWLTTEVEKVPVVHQTDVRFLDDSTLVFNEASADYSQRHVVSAALKTIGERRVLELQSVLDAASGDGEKNVELIDARAVAGTSVRAVLARRRAVTFENVSSSYRLGTPRILADGRIEVGVFYDPTNVDGTCWDQNFNLKFDPAEDLDKSGGAAPTAGDCGLSEATDLAISHGSLTPAKLPNTPPDSALPPLLDATPNEALTADPYFRTISFRAGHSAAGGHVTVEVLAPRGGRPIVKGTLLGTVRFQAGEVAQIGLRVRKTVTTLERWTQVDAQSPWTSSIVPLNDVTEVTDGALSPDASQAALAVVQHARPALLKVSGLTGSPLATKLSFEAGKYSGIDWDKYEPYSACHWLGAHRQPKVGKLVLGYRGLLDEIKAYNYVRSEDAVRSEVERGREWLVKRNANGQTPSNSSCELDTDCGPYELCTAHVCGMDLCGESDTTDTGCSRGQCTLVTGAVAQSEKPVWACSVECNLAGEDRSCLAKECYNGPCRFCAANSCVECQWDPARKVAEGLVVGVLEGCPDGNSFSCEEGSCVSECYSFVNGASEYRCSSAEYCLRGRCVPFQWDWADFSPATLASGARAFYDDNPNLKEAQRAVVRNTTHLIRIEAYGATDTAFAPELRVQAQFKASPYQDSTGQWFELATLSVDNQSASDATSNPYLVLSQFEVTALRFSMVAPAFENANLGARGYLDKNENGEISDPLCADPNFDCNRLPGTRRRLGYGLAYRSDEALNALLVSNDERDRYLLNGEPTIIVSKLTINDQSVSLDKGRNVVCEYKQAGRGLPFAPTDTVNFGAVFARSASQYAVFNCPERAIGTDVTSYELENIDVGLPPAMVSAIENGAGCYYGNDKTTDDPNLVLCYSYAEGPSFDPYSVPSSLYSTLEFMEFTSFGF